MKSLFLLIVTLSLLPLFALNFAPPVYAQCSILSGACPYDPGDSINFSITGIKPNHSIEIELVNANTGERLAEITLISDEIGDGETGNSNSILNQIDDPLPEGRFSSLGQIVSLIAPTILILGGMVAFLFLIMGGFRYMTAQGDPKAIASARGTLTSAIIGLALLASLFVILAVVQFVFKISILVSLAPPAYAQVDIGKEFLFGGKGVDEVFPDFGTFLKTVVSVAIGLAGVVFFVMTLWGGIRYISARGDEKSISDARSTITNAVIGLLIVIASFAIIKLIAIATGADISIF